MFLSGIKPKTTSREEFLTDVKFYHVIYFSLLIFRNILFYKFCKTTVFWVVSVLAGNEVFFAMSRMF